MIDLACICLNYCLSRSLLGIVFKAASSFPSSLGTSWCSMFHPPLVPDQYKQPKRSYTLLSTCLLRRLGRVNCVSLLDTGCWLHILWHSPSTLSVQSHASIPARGSAVDEVSAYTMPLSGAERHAQVVCEEQNLHDSRSQRAQGRLVTAKQFW